MVPCSSNGHQKVFFLGAHFFSRPTKLIDDGKNECQRMSTMCPGYWTSSATDPKMLVWGKKHILNKGTPQGCILNPLLFLPLFSLSPHQHHCYAKFLKPKAKKKSFYYQAVKCICSHHLIVRTKDYTPFTFFCCCRPDYKLGDA